jgi:hypothetical protein
MQIYTVIDDFEEQWWRPYTKKPLADKVLKIVQMALDDTAEILIIEANEYEEQLNAGLLPYKIEVLRSMDGKVLDKKIDLTWPPENEGIVKERDDYVRYFFWAKNGNEAIRKLSSIKRSINNPMEVLANG